MSQALLLLATFLAVVVVGGTLVALHDAVERLWHARRTLLPDRVLVRSPLPARVRSPVRAPVVAPVRTADLPSVRRPGPPAVAWRHLH